MKHLIPITPKSSTYVYSDEEPKSENVDLILVWDKTEVIHPRRHQKIRDDISLTRKDNDLPYHIWW